MNYVKHNCIWSIKILFISQPAVAFKDYEDFGEISINPNTNNLINFFAQHETILHKRLALGLIHSLFDY